MSVEIDKEAPYPERRLSYLSRMFILRELASVEQ